MPMTHRAASGGILRVNVVAGVALMT
jgi:hypothetical protein